MKFRIFIFYFLSILIIGVPLVNAYEFVNPNNEGSVMSDRRDIYSLKKTYDELAGTDDEEVEIEYQPASSDKYWWPIGSSETSTSGGKTFATGDPEDTVITSYFGYRGAVIDGSGRQIAGNENHGALDIANTRGVGVTNVIAAKSGTVVFPTEKDNIGCVQGNNGCNGGYGNYVIIQHSDGNYTLYAHLHTNTITVKAGDVVEQGQVIAKMGSTGNSTGSHLHFEVRLGENTSSARVDPLDYIDKDNPRPSGGPSGDYSLDALFEYINIFEGVGCWNKLSEDGDNYVGCIGTDNTKTPIVTIGHGVTFESNRERFRARGYSSVGEGTRVPKTVVDDIEKEIIKDTYDNVVKNLANHGIDSLKENQLMALVSQSYNGSYVISGGDYSFVDYWPKYKNIYKFEDIYENKPSLWYDSLCRPFGPGTVNEEGLKGRRVSEWMLFTNGIVDHLESGFDSSKYAWPE